MCVCVCALVLIVLDSISELAIQIFLLMPPDHNVSMAHTVRDTYSTIVMVTYNAYNI